MRIKKKKKKGWLEVETNLTIVKDGQQQQPKKKKTHTHTHIYIFWTVQTSSFFFLFSYGRASSQKKEKEKDKEESNSLHWALGVCFCRYTRCASLAREPLILPHMGMFDACAVLDVGVAESFFFFWMGKPHTDAVGGAGRTQQEVVWLNTLLEPYCLSSPAATSEQHMILFKSPAFSFYAVSASFITYSLGKKNHTQQQQTNKKKKKRFTKKENRQKSQQKTKSINLRG